MREDWPRAGMWFERARNQLGAADTPPALSADVWLNSGLLALHSGDHATALEQLQKALAQRPDDYRAAVGVAVALRGVDRWDDARSAYQKAIALQPQKFPGHFGLGVLYWHFLAPSRTAPAARQADVQRALASFRHAAALPGLQPAEQSRVAQFIATIERDLGTP